MSANIRPIFVLGSPRSGTTLLGNYIGSSKEILDLGEYFGFAFTYFKLPEMFATVPSKIKHEYLDSLKKHSVDFAYKITEQSNLKFYCDSTPWNILIADVLVDILPNALFILVIRNYKGVIQSLERSYNDGYKWAGKNLEERAQLYSDCYSRVEHLPLDRTIVVNYDQLCSQPEFTLLKLKDKLNNFGIDSNLFDETIFLHSHATNPKHKRDVLAIKKDDKIIFRPIPSYNKSLWDAHIDQKVYPIVKGSIEKITNKFPNEYLFV